MVQSGAAGGRACGWSPVHTCDGAYSMFQGTERMLMKQRARCVQGHVNCAQGWCGLHGVLVDRAGLLNGLGTTAVVEKAGSMRQARCVHGARTRRDAFE